MLAISAGLRDSAFLLEKALAGEKENQRFLPDLALGQGDQGLPLRTESGQDGISRKGPCPGSSPLLPPALTACSWAACTLLQTRAWSQLPACFLSLLTELSAQLLGAHSRQS